MALSRQISIVVLIILVLIVLGLSQAITHGGRSSVGSVATSTPTATLNGEVFDLELAQTEAERARGLSGRERLGERRGMLFVFPAPSKPAFWMKEMNFPLDIIWVEDTGAVAGIERAVAPETFPQTFSPAGPVKYVLEVRAGTAERLKLQSGDLIHFSSSN